MEVLKGPLFLPGESHGRRSLEGYSLGGRKESDMTKRLTLHYILSALEMTNLWVCSGSVKI